MADWQDDVATRRLGGFDSWTYASADFGGTTQPGRCYYSGTGVCFIPDSASVEHPETIQALPWRQGVLINLSRVNEEESAIEVAGARLTLDTPHAQALTDIAGDNGASVSREAIPAAVPAPVTAEPAAVPPPVGAGPPPTPIVEEEPRRGPSRAFLIVAIAIVVVLGGLIVAFALGVFSSSDEPEPTIPFPTITAPPTTPATPTFPTPTFTTETGTPTPPPTSPIAPTPSLQSEFDPAPQSATTPGLTSPS